MVTVEVATVFLMISPRRVGASKWTRPTILFRILNAVLSSYRAYDHRYGLLSNENMREFRGILDKAPRSHFSFQKISKSL